MDRKKNNKNAQKQQTQASVASAKRASKPRSARKRAAKLNASMGQLAVSRQRMTRLPTSMGGFDALTDRWRKSLLEPFKFPGCVAAGDFFVRNAVPYTIKRTIQVTTLSGVTGGTIVCFPSLNCMAFNPDAGFSFQGADTNFRLTTETITAPNTSGASGVDARLLDQLAGPAVGLSVPQLASVFERYRIVSWGVRLRNDASMLNTSGKIVTACMPYEGYLPIGTYRTDGRSGVAIETVINDPQNYVVESSSPYESHPASTVDRRRHTVAAMLGDLGVRIDVGAGSNIPKIPTSNLYAVPYAEAMTVNDLGNAVLQIAPRPCSANLWTWRDCGQPATVASPGTVNELVHLSAGGDAFPGCVRLYNQGVGSIGNILASPSDVDCSVIKALGFESVIVNFDGLASGAGIMELDLVYNIEAIPAASTGAAVPGLTPASSNVAPRSKIGRSAAMDVVMEVADKAPVSIVDVASAVAGAVGGPMASTIVGAVGQIAGFARQRGGRARHDVGYV